MQKIFGIGWHKTGTTSLLRAMETLGFNCCPEKIAYLTRIGVADGRYHETLQLANDYDFFEDSPWHYRYFYRALLVVFPTAKFIYTYRNPESWYVSLCRWVFLHTIQHDVGILNTVRVPILLDNKKEVIDSYTAYHEQVLQDIPASQLLVFDVESPEGWKPLCEFLEKPIPETPFPHALRYVESVGYIP